MPPMPTTPDRQRAGYYRPDRLNADNSIGYLMRNVLSGLRRTIDSQCVALDLTHAQWLPLYKLWHGQGGTLAELARSCDTDPGAMTRMVDRLEQKGLLRRERSTSDRRVVNLALTEEGMHVAQRVPGVVAAALNQRLTGFREDEVEALIDYLRRMLANAEADPASAPAGPAARSTPAERASA